MREDKEIGRWLALRIGLLFPVIRGEAFAGTPAPTSPPQIANTVENL